MLPSYQYANSKGRRTVRRRAERRDAGSSALGKHFRVCPARHAFGSLRARCPGSAGTYFRVVIWISRTESS